MHVNIQPTSGDDRSSQNFSEYFLSIFWWVFFGYILIANVKNVSLHACSSHTNQFAGGKYKFPICLQIERNNTHFVSFVAKLAAKYKSCCNIKFKLKCFTIQTSIIIYQVMIQLNQGIFECTDNAIQRTSWSPWS